jgi:hypothetical protein
MLLVALPLGSAIAALRRHANPTLGLVRGFVAWLAIVSGYMVLLWIVDTGRRRRGELRPENDVPKWFLPVVCGVFISASAACVLLFARF